MTPRWTFLKGVYSPSFYRPGKVVSFMYRRHQVVAVSGEWITLRRLHWWERISQ